jgi:hypothetical protein
VSVAFELRQKRAVFFGIGEAIELERPDFCVWGVEGESEDAFEMRVGGAGATANLTNVEAGA